MLASLQRQQLGVKPAAVNLPPFRGIFPLRSVKFISRSAVHALIVLTWTVTTSAWAAGGYIYDAVGEVSLGVGKNATRTAVKNDVVSSDTVITTGDKSYVVLKFEDGQIVAIQANAAFHVKEYRFDPKNAEKNNIVFSKFTGGMRFITGLIGQLNHKAFRLSTPNATIGIRGTDFMVTAINDTAYTKVLSGSISITNGAGGAQFTTGQSILVTSPGTLPVAVPASALPTGIFNQLEAIPTPSGIIASSALGLAAGVAAAGASVTLPTGIPTATLLATSTPDTSPPPSTAASAHASSPSAKTVSITGAGATYTGDDPRCDFCTGRTNTVATHTTTAGTAADNPVTGEASLFGKHNLTPSGANTGEICAFCHTPQGAESTVTRGPLWNRTAPPVSSYRAFSSLGSAAAETTGSVSMSCLSCHDGSQAPNIVINTPDNILNIPEGLQINIGNGLKNHHPVGMPYAGGGQNQNAPDIPPDPVAAYTKLAGFNAFTSTGNKFTFFDRRGLVNSNDVAAFNDVGTFSKAGTFNREDFNKSTYSGTGTGTVWWIETPGSKKGRQKSDLYLFTRTDTIDSIPSESVLSQPYVECATCHDAHSTNPTFLRLPGGNARSQVCLTCHNK